MTSSTRCSFNLFRSNFLHKMVLHSFFNFYLSKINIEYKFIVKGKCLEIINCPCKRAVRRGTEKAFCSGINSEFYGRTVSQGGSSQKKCLGGDRVALEQGTLCGPG